MKLEEISIYKIGDTVQMVGAIYAGEGQTFLCFFPEDKNELPHVNLEMNLEDWKKFLFQTDVMETEVLTKGSDGALVKAILRKSQRNIDASVSWKVYKRDGYACRYCANDDVPLTVDHLVCWEEGGPSIESNLLASCKKCNKTRGNLPYAEWLNHPHYRRVAQNLSADTRQANADLVATLDKVPRLIHKRSR